MPPGSLVAALEKSANIGTDNNGRASTSWPRGSHGLSPNLFLSIGRAQRIGAAEKRTRGHSILRQV